MKKLFKKFYNYLPISLKKKIKNFYLNLYNIYNFFVIIKRKEFLIKIIRNNNFEKIKGIIIYLPTIDWDTEIFQRPHQISIELSRRQYLVFFITPNSKENIKGFKKINNNLFVTDSPISSFNILKNYNFKIIIYISLPSNVVLIKYFKIKNYILLYDIIDELEIFYGYCDEMIKQHEYLLKYSNIILTTADNLFKKAKFIRKDAVLCPNGCDYNHFHNFEKETEIPYDLKNLISKNNIIIGYHGSLAEWIDYELLKYIVLNIKNSKVILIGPDYDGSLQKSNILNIKNIYWLGSKNYVDLPKYIKWFDVAILPFKKNKITESTSPIKMFEYMAAQIPIVSVDLSEPKKYKSVLIAKNYNEFIELIFKAKDLKNNNEYLSLIDKEAKENSWENRVKLIDDIIQNKFNDK